MNPGDTAAWLAMLRADVAAFNTRAKALDVHPRGIGFGAQLGQDQDRTRRAAQNLLRRALGGAHRESVSRRRR